VLEHIQQSIVGERLCDVRKELEDMMRARPGKVRRNLAEATGTVLG
jgi:hypothetical protein